MNSSSNSMTTTGRPTLTQFVFENEDLISYIHQTLIELNPEITFEATCRFVYDYSF